MDDKELPFVVISGDVCVPWDNISRLSWEDDRKLTIGFRSLAGSDATTSWRLTDGQAYEFWEQYTGQRFPADTRPLASIETRFKTLQEIDPELVRFIEDEATTKQAVEIIRAEAAAEAKEKEPERLSLLQRLAKSKEALENQNKE